MSVKVTELKHGAHLYFRTDTIQNGLNLWNLWVVWREGNAEEVVGEHWEKLFFSPNDAVNLCEERGFKLMKVTLKPEKPLANL